MHRESGMATSRMPANPCRLDFFNAFHVLLLTLISQCRFNFLDMSTFAKLEASRSLVHRMRTGIL